MLIEGYLTHFSRIPLLPCISSIDIHLLVTVSMWSSPNAFLATSTALLKYFSASS